VLADLDMLERWKVVHCVVVEVEDEPTHCLVLSDSVLSLLAAALAFRAASSSLRYALGSLQQITDGRR
jgi:hypothetical protein